MNSKEEIKYLLSLLKPLSQFKGVSEKEVLLSIEVFNEVKTLCLKEEPLNDRQKQLAKSKAIMTEANALLALKVRIKNLMEGLL